MAARTAARKQATVQKTGALSFCLSTLSPLQVPGYWPTGEATVVGRPVSLSPGSFSRATVSTGRQNITAVETLNSCYCLAAALHGCLVAARAAGGRTAQILGDPVPPTPLDDVYNRDTLAGRTCPQPLPSSLDVRRRRCHLPAPPYSTEPIIIESKMVHEHENMRDLSD